MHDIKEALPVIDPPASLPRRWSALLWHFIRQYPLRCLALPLVAGSQRAVNASIAVATKNIIDAVSNLEGHDPQTIIAGVTAPFLLFAGLIIGRFLVDLLTWALSYNTRFVLMARMRQELFAYVQRHPTSYFDNELSGRIAHKTMLVPEQLLTIFERMVFDFIPSTIFFIVVGFYFYAESPIFAWAMFVYLPVYFAACLWHGRKISKYAETFNAARTMVTGRIADVITNIKNVIFFGRQRFEDMHVGAFIDAEKRRRQSLYIAIVRLRVMQYMFDIAMWLFLFAAAIYAWIDHRITVGGFAMVTSLAGMLLKTAWDIGQIFPDFFETLGSAQDGIDTILVPHMLHDRANAKPLAVAKGEIRFDKVGFTYENNRAVFQNLDLVIPAGQKVGLIGASGAGKTTLAALILRLHDVQSGRILIDGQDIAGATQESLRHSVGVIPQDTMLFHRTLKENIRYGRAEATDEEVIDAARRAHADEFIRLLEKGYDTLVGERGVKLSGGQRQRIAIARALLKNAPILLLDEATSALDSESEMRIQEAMSVAMAGKTVIAIAHRLSTIMHLDRLIVLEDGQVCEDGAHAQLLAKGGVYARLWRKQSGGFLSDEDEGVPESA
jgi:ABC-type multidrug transport system fused ATPase/permease subunit